MSTTQVPGHSEHGRHAVCKGFQIQAHQLDSGSSGISLRLSFESAREKSIWNAKNGTRNEFMSWKTAILVTELPTLCVYFRKML